MKTISDDYRRLNAQLHKDREDYGAGTQTRQWYPLVGQFAQIMNAASILDYGCGKSTLAQTFSHMVVIPYDPAIPGIDDPPDPHDVVVCLDVLEHIEPELLDAVLDDLKRCTLKGIFLTVNMRPAYKVLADGRNAHLIQKPLEWWLPKLMERWHILGLTHRAPIEFVFTGQPHVITKAQELAA